MGDGKRIQSPSIINVNVNVSQNEYFQLVCGFSSYHIPVKSKLRIIIGAVKSLQAKRSLHSEENVHRFCDTFIVLRGLQPTAIHPSHII